MLFVFLLALILLKKALANDKIHRDQQSIAFLLNGVLKFISLTDGKKARQFDFMAMFEQTKKTAVERSQNTLGERLLL